MTTRTVGWVALCGFLMAGTGGVQAHHALAGVYDLQQEVTLQGALKKLNFTNPHSSIELTVLNKDGSTTDWVLVTASNRLLTRQGITKTSIKPGDVLKIVALPAKNGNPMGFIRSLDLGDREIQLFFEDGQN
jgi:DNA/RNA endonuclease YhcR with UshA esterase domain